MGHLIARLTPEVVADLRRWAWALIAEPDVRTDVEQPLTSVPQFVRVLNGEQAEPGAVVYRRKSVLGPSVVLMWRHDDKGVLVLIIGTVDFELDSFLGTLWHARKLFPGIYCCFYGDG
jgi:hypothetical protein